MERTLLGPGGATEAKQDEILTVLKSEKKLLFDYTGGPTVRDPVYIGAAIPTALDTDAVWTIRKLTYTGSEVSKIELRTLTAWSGRSAPSPAWD